MLVKQRLQYARLHVSGIKRNLRRIKISDSAGKKRSVVRGKVRWIAPQNVCHGRVPFEFPVKKPADGLAVPAKRVDKIGI